MARTINAKEEMKAYNLNDFSEELASYTGYVQDAIFEIASGWTSIYTYDQIRYRREHPEDMREAIAMGLALDASEYFRANPSHDFDDYEAHVGAIAECMNIEQGMQDELGESLEYVALSHLRDVFGETLDGDAWDHVKAMRSEDDDLDDVREEAEKLYREYLGDSEALAA